MFFNTKEKIVARLARHSFKSDDELYLFMMLIAAISFCLLTHIYLFFVFLSHSIFLYIVINAGSIAIYCCLFWLLKGRRFFWAGFLLSMEVTIYSTIFGFSHGISTYIIGYYLMVLVMQLMVPYASMAFRGAVMAGIFICTTASLFAHFYLPSITPLASGLRNVLMVSNIYVLFLGTVIELLIGNFLRRFIGNLNQKRITELSSQVVTDPLTGLYNRRYAQHFFTSVLPRQGRQGCVAMLDIDDFKQINDSHGHACGDEILVFLSRFLTRHLRKSDTVFRWGGEEFLLVLADIDLSAANTVLDKLRDVLSAATIQTAAAPIQITVTIGVAALVPASYGASIEESDSRLYKGKRSGKNMVVHQ